MSPPRLYLNHIAELDWLIALEFGRVDDGQPSEHWDGVTEDFGWLNDAPDGRVLGFKVLDFSEFDADDEDVEEIWDGPRFDVPVLGLTEVTAGEIVIAARAFFGGCSSINRAYFDEAVELQGEAAVDMWLGCLQAGDAMAHFGLGYTLFELGRFHDAYRHLRHYAEIAPAGPWNWCWFGKAAAAIGELDEARAAYRRAISLEQDGEDETDAAELLAAIDSGQEAR
ncbi:MAG: hypothetical protein M3P50_03065 [Actinomycetota bacterium]|nr:hypothetical protein [Actinomycetota bacterium]